MNPAVIDPSHMPRMRRTTNNPAKFLQAACVQRATPQIKMLMLGFKVNDHSSLSSENDVPHPLADWEPLQCQVLRVLEDEVTQVEDGAEPVVSTMRLSTCCAV